MAPAVRTACRTRRSQAREEEKRKRERESERERERARESEREREREIGAWRSNLVREIVGALCFLHAVLLRRLDRRKPHNREQNVPQGARREPSGELGEPPQRLDPAVQLDVRQVLRHVLLRVFVRKRRKVGVEAGERGGGRHDEPQPLRAELAPRVAEHALELREHDTRVDRPALRRAEAVAARGQLLPPRTRASCDAACPISMG